MRLIVSKHMHLFKVMLWEATGCPQRILDEPWIATRPIIVVIKLNCRLRATCKGAHHREPEAFMRLDCPVLQDRHLQPIGLMNVSK